MIAARGPLGGTMIEVRLGRMLLMACLVSGCTGLETIGPIGAGGGRAGGAGGAGGGVGGGGVFDAGPPEAPSTRSSRSSAVALDAREQVGAAVMPDTDQLTVFRVSLDFGLPPNPITLDLPPGAMPVSVALHPDGAHAFVVLRKHQRLARIGGLPFSPQLEAQAEVGSEPTGVALSPTGRIAVVANFGESSVSIVDTQTMQVKTVAVADHPRAVAITNNGDGSDLDESAWVTLFYGALRGEGTDDGRVGRLVELKLATGTVGTTIELEPISNAGAGNPLPDGGTGPEVTCSPNQLYAVAIAWPRAFVAHVCVAPQGPVFKFTNLFAGISVVDLAAGTEVRGPGGSFSLSRLMESAGTRFGLPIDLDVAEDGGSLMVLAQAANELALLAIGPGAPVTLRQVVRSVTAPCGYVGCPGGPGVPGPPTPAGVPIALAAGLRTNTVLIVDGTGQLVSQTVSGFPFRSIPLGRLPPVGSSAFNQRMGKKFFYTAQDRWSDQNVSSCASCHPDGLSDNVTWVFPAGPRQTPALDGTFARHDVGDHRAQNWTANFDEIYDVEGNTRGTSGGRGAITSGPPQLDTPIALGVAISIGGGPIGRNDNLSGSARAVTLAYSQLPDWSQIEAWVQQIPTNRAPTRLPAAAVQRGRDVFASAGCGSCHGGPKWTISRVPYVPSPVKNGTLVGENGLPAAPTGLRTELRAASLPGLNFDTYKVAVERFTNPDGGASLAIGPERITCVLRDVGTFDAANPFEKKSDGTRAQGALGFNPPSLLGLAGSAPYLHHGAAPTLEALFTPRYARHHQAGRAGFLANGGASAAEQQQVQDLVAFLQSIDGDTPTFLIDPAADICTGY